jgi:hypothetical protein
MPKLSKSYQDTIKELERRIEVKPVSADKPFLEPYIHVLEPEIYYLRLKQQIKLWNQVTFCNAENPRCPKVELVQCWGITCWRIEGYYLPFEQAIEFKFSKDGAQ